MNNINIDKRWHLLRSGYGLEQKVPKSGAVHGLLTNTKAGSNLTHPCLDLPPLWAINLETAPK